MKKPAVFGKYVLLERIGVGGMAEVFRARASGGDGRLVAIKRILPRVAEDPDFVRQFLDEARRAAQLSHASIAQIVDLGVVEGACYLALDHVHGRDVRGIFERCRQLGDVMPIAQACFLVMKVCEGLDYAHNKRDPSGRELVVLHRDVSPPNILVSFEGEVKLTDFGLAKALGAAGPAKRGYLSPEQLRNDPGAPIDRRSDVFSCGVVLYELLTGERLFPGETDRAAQLKVRSAEILAPSAYNRKIPAELERIVMKALAIAPMDRYPSALELHDELQAFVYTAGEFYSRKDLGGWMKRTFGKELEHEIARLEGYRQLVLPAPPPARPATSPPVAGDPVAGSPALRAATASKPPRPMAQLLKHTPPPVLGPRTPPMPFIAAPTPTAPESRLSVPQPTPTSPQAAPPAPTVVGHAAAARLLPAPTAVGHAAAAMPLSPPARAPGAAPPVARLDALAIGWEDDDVETQIYADQDAGLKHLAVLPKASPREGSPAATEPARAPWGAQRPVEPAERSLGEAELGRTQRPVGPAERALGEAELGRMQRPVGPAERALGEAEPGRAQRGTQRPVGPAERALGEAESGREQRGTQRPAGIQEVSLARTEPARAQRATQRRDPDVPAGWTEPARPPRATQRRDPEVAAGATEPARPPWATQPPEVQDTTPDARAEFPSQARETSPGAAVVARDTRTDPRAGRAPGARDTTPDAGMERAPGARDTTPGAGMERAPGARDTTPGAGMERAPGARDTTPDAGIERAAGARDTTPDAGMERAPGARDTTPDAGMERAPRARDTTPDAGTERAPGARETTPDAGGEAAPAVRSTQRNGSPGLRQAGLADLRPELRPAAVADVRPAAVVDVWPELRREHPAHGKPELRPELPADTRRDARSELRPEVSADAQSEPPADARRDAQPELRSAALADARRDAPAERRPEAREPAPRDARREPRGDPRRDVLPGASAVPAAASGWDHPVAPATSPQAPPPRFDLHDGNEAARSRTPGSRRRELSAASRLVSPATPVSRALDPMASFGARIVGAHGARSGRRAVFLLAILGATIAVGLVIAIVALFGRPALPPPPVAPPAAKPILADPSTGFDLYVAPAGLMHWKLDGEARTDRLPSRIRGIAAGTHTVEIEPPAGFSSQVQHIDIELGKAPRVEIKLQPISVVASFETTPPGATVSLIVDGKRQPIGPSPAKAPLDARSSYQVLFEKPGYVAVNRSITFTGVAEEHIAVKLDKVSDKPASPPR